MAYTYKGTKITGTSTTAKTFPKSGISNAKKGEEYFNTDTGHVYKCTEKGKAKDAKWKYARTDIAHKPDTSIAKLSTPSRNGTRLKTEWAIPAALTNKSNGRRAENIVVRWTVSETRGGKVRRKNVVNTGGTGYTSSTFNYNDYKVGKTKYTRASFYPLTKRTLNNITIHVAPKNSKGRGEWESKTYDFQKPNPPKLGAVSFNTETGEVSVVITAAANSGVNERYDTHYQVKIWDSKNGKRDKANKIIPEVKSEGNFTGSSYTAKYDAPHYQRLSYKEYILVQVSAYSRGLQGNSAPVKKQYYISYPAATTINRVSFDKKTSTGKFTVYLDTNYHPNGTKKSKDPINKAHPVDRVRLEYLANCDYAKISQIPGDAAWEASEIMDDGQCTALSAPVAQLLPEAGKYTWVRVKSWHANEAVLYRYSNYAISKLETEAPTAADDEIKILAVEPGKDGQSLVVQLVWDDGATSSTGTELTWSEDEDAWRSTDDPDSYNFTWSDGSREVDGVNWPGSATITIKGLDAGTQYYVSARRYLEGDDETTYSVYANKVDGVTSETPETITISCEQFIPQGSSLPVNWALSGNGAQRRWQIITHNSTVVGDDYIYEKTTDYVDPEDEDAGLPVGKTYFTRSGSGTEADPYVYAEVQNPVKEDLGIYYERSAADGEVIANGEGQLCSTKLDSATLETFAIDGKLAFTVQATTGGEWVVSEVCPVTISDPPEVAVTVESPLTTQPLSFTANVTSISKLQVIVTSLGAVGQFPQGVRNQVRGDTIHSGVYTPDWTESGTGFTAGITLPAGLDFWDKGTYELSVVAIDLETNLQSEPSVMPVTVAWDNQAVAPLPIENYTATADTAVDGNKNYYVNIEDRYDLVVPEGDEDPSAEGWLELSVTSFITLTPMDTVTDNGEHLQAVQIDLTPPHGSYILSSDSEIDTGKTYYSYSEGTYIAVTPEGTESPVDQGWYELRDDVYDIYRMTGDGPRLISGEGFPLTYTVVDRYAPFGDAMTHHYRIALRTADGDVEFGDFEYELQCTFIRFDWATGSLELPYNITIGDEYEKDVDIRSHMDGSVDGYWNPNITRKASLNSDVIRLTMQDEITAARMLARYSGPVFVRTSDGSAYEADVQVADMSTDGQMTAIAIDATEIGLTDEFTLLTPYIHEEEP